MACGIAAGLTVRVATEGVEREQYQTGGLVWSGGTRAGCLLLDALVPVASALKQALSFYSVSGKN